MYLNIVVILFIMFRVLLMVSLCYTLLVYKDVLSLLFHKAMIGGVKGRPVS